MKVKHLTVKRYISDRNDTPTPLHKLLQLITNWYTLDERFLLHIRNTNQCIIKENK